MRRLKFSHVHSLILGVALLALAKYPTSAQQAASQGVNAQPLISQLAAVFSHGQVVQQVQLSGSATWYAGSLEDTGTVNLTASTSGSSQMQLALATTGSRTETSTGSGLNTTCQWAGADGVAHQIESGSCLRPALWFVPALSLSLRYYPAVLGSPISGLVPSAPVQVSIVFSRANSCKANSRRVAFRVQQLLT